MSKYHKISTNNKEMEVTYIQFYSRQTFTTVRKQLQVDGDGLSAQQRSMLCVHKYLIIPEGICPNADNDISCPSWHSKCVIQVPTIERANEIWSIIQRIDPNACTMTSASKGILVRRKDTKLEKMPVEFEEYVTVYLQEKGILGDWNKSEWSPLMKEVKYILLQGKLYRPGCDVIVKQDPDVATPYKARIKRFFTHEFGGEIRVFFSADYYLHLQDEVDGRLVDLIDEITGMNAVLNNRMFPYSYTSIRPVEMFLCKFMKVTCPAHIGQQYSVAYAMDDLQPRDRIHYRIVS